MAGTIGRVSPNSMSYGYNGSQYGSMQDAQNAQNNDPGSKAATSAAQQAVQGLQNSGNPNAGHWGVGAGGGANTWIPDTGAAGTTTGGGGEGSFYSIDNQGKTSSTVTPNLLPQQAQLQQQQTQLEGQLATGARTQAGGIAGEAASKQNDYAMQQEAQKAALAKSNWDSQWAQLNSGGGAPPPREQMGPGGGMNDQESQARAAAFARAKEQAGGTAQGAMKGLQGAMEDRGMMGSSLEAQGMGNIVGGAANGVNDFTREQLIQDLNRYSGIADETYQGNIAQRGQDTQLAASRQNSLVGLMNSMRY